jgi:hypothetical protein
MMRSGESPLQARAADIIQRLRAIGKAVDIRIQRQQLDGLVQQAPPWIVVTDDDARRAALTQ